MLKPYTSIHWKTNKNEQEGWKKVLKSKSWEKEYFERYLLIDFGT